MASPHQLLWTSALGSRSRPGAATLRHRSSRNWNSAVGLLLLEQRPRAVAVEVTQCLRRKLVPSSVAEMHAGLSASWIARDTPAGKAPFNMQIHSIAAS